MSTESDPQARSTGQYGWRIGSISSVPVYLGRSWPVIGIAVLFLFGPQIQAARPDQGMGYAYVVAALYAVLLLVSVLAHEAAHAVTAVRSGYQVSRVVVHLLGGHTIYESAGNRPGANAVVAVSGPLANLALAALSYGLQQVVPWTTAWMLLGASTFANLFVGLFNLLPGLPLDGGHLVESAVWGATGSRNRGLVFAGWSGRLVTAAVVIYLAVLPLLRHQSLDLFTIVWVVVIGGFLWAGSSRAVSVGRARVRLDAVPLREVLRPLVVVGASTPISQLADVDPQGTVVVLSELGRPLGILDPDTVRAIPVADRAVATAAMAVRRVPEPWVVQADLAGGVLPVVEVMGVAGAAVVVVLGPDGQALGCVHQGDLDAALTA